MNAKITNLHFQLCKIFLDETTFNYENMKHFMLGAILLPIDCDLPLKLGQIRKKFNFFHTLHFSKGKKFSEKKQKVMNEFLRNFTESNACFRAIVVNKDTWERTDNYKSQAKLTGLLLSYPWILYEGKIYNRLSRARIIFDRKSWNLKQQNEFQKQLNRILKKGIKTDSLSTYPIEDASIVFADKRIFDELQLVDIIIGIIRISYLMKEKISISPTKKKIYDRFLGHFPKLKTFIKADRRKTNQKLDVWHFSPKEKG